MDQYDTTPTTPDIIRRLRQYLPSFPDDSSQSSIHRDDDDDSSQSSIDPDVENARAIFNKFKNREGYELFRKKHGINDENENDIFNATRFILVADDPQSDPQSDPPMRLNSVFQHNHDLIQRSIGYDDLTPQMKGLVEALLRDPTFMEICIDRLNRRTGGKSKKRTRKRSCKKCKTLKRSKGKKGRGRHLKSKRKSNRV